MTPFDEVVYQRQYRIDNAERLKAYAQLRKERDPEKYAAQKRADYEKHMDAYKARAKAHRIANAERIKAMRRTPEYRAHVNALRKAKYIPSPKPAPMTAEQKRVKAREFYYANLEREKATRRAYYKANKSKWRNDWNKREYWVDRFSRSLKAAGITKKDPADRVGLREFYKNVFTKDEGKCVHCENIFPIKQITIDHTLPFKRGGKHEVNNLAVSCFKCNSTKGSMTLEEFKQYKLDNNI